MPRGGKETYGLRIGAAALAPLLNRGRIVQAAFRRPALGMAARIFWPAASLADTRECAVDTSSHRSVQQSLRAELVEADQD